MRFGGGFHDSSVRVARREGKWGRVLVASFAVYACPRPQTHLTESFPHSILRPYIAIPALSPVIPTHSLPRHSLSFPRSPRHSRTLPRHSREGGNLVACRICLPQTVNPPHNHSRTLPRHSREGGNLVACRICLPQTANPPHNHSRTLPRHSHTPSRHSRTHPRHSRTHLRHSREGGNLVACRICCPRPQTHLTIIPSQHSPPLYCHTRVLPRHSHTHPRHSHTHSRHSRTLPPSFPRRRESSRLPYMLAPDRKPTPPSFPPFSPVIPALLPRHSRPSPPSFPPFSPVIPAPLTSFPHPPPSFPHFSPVIPALSHVIPAKAGI